MNYEQDADDLYFGYAGEPLEDPFKCGSPGPMVGGENSLGDHLRTDHFGDPLSPSAFPELSGIPLHDNSLAVPIDDYQSDLIQNEKQFATLQPPVQVPCSSYSELSSMTLEYSHMSNGQSSMGMNGGMHHSMNDDGVQVEMIPVQDYHHQLLARPSSQNASRPSSRTPLNSSRPPKSETPLQHILSQPSTSSPVPSLPKSKSSSKSRAPPPARIPNGRKKIQQNSNTVGAVLAKANKLAQNSQQAAGEIRLSVENTALVSVITKEIEQLKSDPHRGTTGDNRIKELETKRASIFFEALAKIQSQETGSIPSMTPSAVINPPPRRTAHRSQPVSSPSAYTPQCGNTYDLSIGSSSIISSTQYHSTPTARTQTLYKVATTTSANAIVQSYPLSTGGQPRPTQKVPVRLIPPPPTIRPPVSIPIAAKQPQLIPPQQIPSPALSSIPSTSQGVRYSPAQCVKRVEEKKQFRLKRLRDCMADMAMELSRPQTEAPFRSEQEALRRLLPYHFFYEPDLAPSVLEEFDLQFLRSMVDVGERMKVMENKFRGHLFKEAINPHEEEHNLLLFLEGEYERKKLEEERLLADEDPEALFPVLHETNSIYSSNSHPSPSSRLKCLPPLQGRPPPILFESLPFVERYRLPTPTPSPSPSPFSSPQYSSPIRANHFNEMRNEMKEEVNVLPSLPSSSFSQPPPLRVPSPLGLEEEAEDDSETSLSPEIGYPPPMPAPPIQVQKEPLSPHKPVLVDHPQATVPPVKVSLPIKKESSPSPPVQRENVVPVVPKLKLKMLKSPKEEKKEEEDEEERVNGVNKKKHKKKKKKRKHGDDEKEDDEEREMRKRMKKEEKRRREREENEETHVPRIKIKLGLPPPINESPPSTIAPPTPPKEVQRIPKLTIKIGKPQPPPPPSTTIVPPTLRHTVIEASPALLRPSPIVHPQSSPMSHSITHHNSTPFTLSSIKTTQPILMGLQSLRNTIEDDEPQERVQFSDDSDEEDTAHALQSTADAALNRCSVSARPLVPPSPSLPSHTSYHHPTWSNHEPFP